VLVSLRDHLMRESLFNIPALYPSNRFREFDQVAQFDYLVEAAAPWYLSYYASWHIADTRRIVDMLWVTYEDARSDWLGTIRSVMSFCGIECADHQISQALESMSDKPQSQTRINVGLTGRGLTLLSAEQRGRVSRMARFYPEVDFSRIGIPAR